MDKIYFVVFISKKWFESSKISHMTWGWLPTLEDAEEVVLNAEGMNELECVFDHAVIEESEPGYCHVGIKEIGWYKYTYNESGICDDPVTVTKIDRPDFVKGACSFSMG